MSTDEYTAGYEQRKAEAARTVSNEIIEVRTLQAIRAALAEAGYVQTAADRQEHPSEPLAVETGYTHREIRAKIWKTNRARTGENDEGTRNVQALQTISGIGTHLADDVTHEVQGWLTSWAQDVEE